MANKGKIQRNDLRKKMVKKWAERRSELKSKQRDRSLSMQERFSLALELDRLPRNGSCVRVRRRCHVTGRPRGLVWGGVSRVEFRNCALRGELPGVTLSSW